MRSLGKSGRTDTVLLLSLFTLAAVVILSILVSTVHDVPSLTGDVVYGTRNCIETDAGKDFFVKGTTKSISPTSSIERVDICKGDNLTEYYCSNYAGIASIVQTCEFGCLEGACQLAASASQPQSASTYRVRYSESLNIRENTGIIGFTRQTFFGESKFATQFVSVNRDIKKLNIESIRPVENEHSGTGSDYLVSVNSQLDSNEIITILEANPIASSVYLVASCIGIQCARSTTGNTCANGQQDQGEQGIDCGGICPNACTATSTQIPVISIAYYPLDYSGLNLDPTLTGEYISVDQKRQEVSSMNAQVASALSSSSGYLDFRIMEENQYFTALPIGLTVPWNPSAHRPDYRSILNSINICNYVDGRGVREVWLWGYHYGNIEPAESDMSMGLKSQEYWPQGTYGDLSNSEQTDDMPVCQNTYVLYNYNYQRSAGEALHNHGHQLETVLGNMDSALFWGNFAKLDSGAFNTHSGCGNIHFPPNTAMAYGYNDAASVPSDCDNWQPDGSGTKSVISCSAWGCDHAGYVSWWMRHLPGPNNGKTFQGHPLRNWWEFYADFDAAIAKGKNLVETQATVCGNSKCESGETVLNCPVDCQAQGGTPGMISNSGYQGQKTKAALVFTGPPNPTSVLVYSRHPLDATKLDWTDDTDVRFAFDQLKDIGVNTIKMSHWSSDGSLCGETLPINGESTCGQIVSTERRKVQISQVFRIAQEKNLLVAPYLEVSQPPPGWTYSPGTTPQYFPFYSEFPSDTRNLRDRIKWLVDNFKSNQNWLTMYDTDGQPRKVIWLIETISASSVDEASFASAFDSVANEIYATTGERIGFIIDPTPLPMKGSYRGPSPTQLKSKTSILAVNPFNVVDVAPSYNLDSCKPIASPFCEQEFTRKSRETLAYWKNSGIPLIVPIQPGYDDRLVPGRSGLKYGDNAFWRTEQQKLVKDFDTAGISIDTWNGYTEGYVVTPTTELSRISYDWAKAILSGSANVCGNGICESGETSCPSDCDKPQVCGNGQVEGTEQCDDGNSMNGDGCSLACTYEPRTSPCAPIGDVNSDGIVNTSDSSEIRRIFLGLIPLTADISTRADVNDDNRVDGADLVFVNRYSWWLESTFPACQSTQLICGNGIKEGVEQCDDGNTVNTDACTNLCKTAVCGDALVRLGIEECDDGNQLNTDVCTTQCQLAICGDFFVRTGVEQCDDGNVISTDACTASCQSARCGDNIVRTGVETCDDGNTIGGDGCSAVCVIEPLCGNGVLNPPEQCDDGNTINTDACVAGCQLWACGDSYVRTGFEQCDDGNTVNVDACTNACLSARCGDAIVRLGIEECDDGNTLNSDACVSSCQLAICGDSFVRQGVEQCDDGNTVNTDACTISCKLPVCGDGYIQSGELCDDGNVNNGDGCSSVCSIEQVCTKTPPSVPIIISPTEMQSVQGTGIVLDWSDVTWGTECSATQTKSYRVHLPANPFSGASAGNLIATTSQSTYQLPNQLLSNTLYSFQIVAVNGNGLETRSAIRTFSTAQVCSGSPIPYVIPSTVNPSQSYSIGFSGIGPSCSGKLRALDDSPGCTSPLATTTVGDTSVGWPRIASSTAGTYTFYLCVDLDGNGNFLGAQEQTRSVSLTVQCSPPPSCGAPPTGNCHYSGTTYDANGCFVSCGTLICTACNPTATPNIISPTQSQIVTPGVTMITWNDGGVNLCSPTAAHSYRVHLAANPFSGATSGNQIGTTGQNSFQIPATLLSNTMYSVQIVADYGLGLETRSAIRTFSTPQVCSGSPIPYVIPATVNPSQSYTIGFSGIGPSCSGKLRAIDDSPGCTSPLATTTVGDTSVGWSRIAPSTPGTYTFYLCVDLDGNGNFLGAQEQTAPVTLTVQAEACGNGIREGIEQCDDGNTINTDACTTSCNNAVCGDGFVRAGVEQCDVGAANSVCPNACSSTCTLNSCVCTGTSPSAPLILAPQVFTEGATILWGSVTNWGNECSGSSSRVYRLYFMRNPYSGLGPLIATTTGTTYTVQNLVPGVAYSYQVGAVNANGAESRSTIGTLVVPNSCYGNLAMNVVSSTVNSLGLVQFSIGNLTYCNGKSIKVDDSAACSSPLASGSILSNEQNIYSNMQVTAPATAGTITYYACVDKNGDTDYLDQGEQVQKQITVVSPPCTTCPSGYVANGNYCDPSCLASGCRQPSIACPVCGNGICEGGEANTVVTCIRAPCDPIPGTCPTDCGEKPSSCTMTCYDDLDGDGYGAGAAQICCSIGVGKSANNLDCYDLNAEAHPGQTAFFSDNRGDKSFDYNCDGMNSQTANAQLSPPGIRCTTTTCAQWPVGTSNLYCGSSSSFNGGSCPGNWEATLCCN